MAFSLITTSLLQTPHAQVFGSSDAEPDFVAIFPYSYLKYIVILQNILHMKESLGNNLANDNPARKPPTAVLLYKRCSPLAQYFSSPPRLINLRRWLRDYHVRLCKTSPLLSSISRHLLPRLHFPSLI